MSRIRIVAFAVLLCIAVFTLSGCGYGGDKRFIGWWTYEKEGANTRLSFNEERFSLSSIAIYDHDISIWRLIW